MQRFMLALDHALVRHRRIVVGIWIALLVAAVPFAARQSENLTGGGFLVHGSQSAAVVGALGTEFPNVERANLSALVEAPTPAARAAAIRTLDRAAAAAPDVVLLPGVRARALTQSASAPAVIVPLHLSVSEDHAQDVAGDLRDRLGLGAHPGPIHLVGQGALWSGLQQVSKDDLASAEATGFPIVLLILLVVFGSFAAAMLPLALGLVAVVLTGALIFLLSQAMDMSVFVTNMASMIGIGVAVDYSLFILARYREEIRDGADPDTARATALATSGSAVVFSGVTVIVSLAGLWMIDSAALRSMALGAILVVAVAVIGAVTLLPVLIRLLGHRAYARNRTFTVAGLLARSRAPRRPGSTRPGAVQRGFWDAWTARVTRRPWVSVGFAAGVLLVLAIPTLSLETGAGALRQLPPGDQTRAGIERAAKLAGPGAAAPAQVLVSLRSGTAGDPANAAVLDRVRARLAADPAIAKVVASSPSRDGRSVVITAASRADHESDAAKASIVRLRAALPTAAGPAATVAVGGAAAAQIDITDLISGSMWKILLFVLGFSYVVLLILLRSVLLPLKAVLVNLLSVGAAYGVLVAVFQWGWLDSALGFDSPGFIDTLNPPLILAVVFGLSMDYEVFLLSRIRERYEAHGDSRLAVSEGLAASARTISSAALIMVAVFSVFVFTGVPSIKQIGLGNAVAVALDATLVRLVLVPALMELLGDWNWWLPRPLARVLPRADFETAPQPARAG